MSCLCKCTVLCNIYGNSFIVMKVKNYDTILFTEKTMIL